MVPSTQRNFINISLYNFFKQGDTKNVILHPPKKNQQTIKQENNQQVTSVSSISKARKGLLSLSLAMPPWCDTPSWQMSKLQMLRDCKNLYTNEYEIICKVIKISSRIEHRMYIYIHGYVWYNDMIYVCILRETGWMLFHQQLNRALATDP